MENSIPFIYFRGSRNLLANSGNGTLLVGFFVSGGHGVEADEGTGRLERLMDMKSSLCSRSQKGGVTSAEGYWVTKGRVYNLQWVIEDLER